MFPAFKIASLELSTYGICVAVGLFLMFFTAYKLGGRYRLKIEDIFFGGLSSLVGAFLGAHILYALTNLESIIKYLGTWSEKKLGFDYFLEIFRIYGGGMVFYGGLIAALLTGMLYCKLRRVTLGQFSDCYAVGIPLFHCFGRIGCFLSGCCYGIESEFGFTAHNAIVDSCNGVNRFPVQLLESVLNLVLFAVLMLLFQKRIMNNKLIFVYMLSYGVIRFLDEFLRGDEYRGIFFGLSTSQWISAALVIISLIFILKKNYTNRYSFKYN